MTKVFIAHILFALFPTLAFAAPDLPKIEKCMHEYSCKKMVVVAHRMGFMGPHENSLWALRQNLNLDSDILEVPVRETSDRVPVALHDDTIDRTTNGKGNVGWMTFRQLRKYQIKDIGEPIPSLEEILDFAKDRFFLQISVKSASVARVWSIIKAKHMSRQVLIFLYKVGQHQEINNLLNKGEQILFMPRFHKGDDLEHLLNYFKQNSPFVEIDEETLMPETIQILNNHKVRPYMNFPTRYTIREVRQLGLDLIAKGLLVFQSDQTQDIYKALPEYR